MRDTTRPLILAIVAAIILGTIVLVYAKISPTFSYNFTSCLKSNADYYQEVPVAMTIELESDAAELPADGSSVTNIYAYPKDANKNSVADQKLRVKTKFGQVSGIRKSEDGGYEFEYTAGTKKGVDIITVIDESTYRKIKNKIKIKLY